MLATVHGAQGVVRQQRIAACKGSLPQAGAVGSSRVGAATGLLVGEMHEWNQQRDAKGTSETDVRDQAGANGEHSPSIV